MPLWFDVDFRQGGNVVGKRVVGAKKNKKGNIVAVRLEGNSTFTDVETAKKMADRREITNAHTAHRRDGSSYLRTNPDDKKGNNLDDMANNKK